MDELLQSRAINIWHLSIVIMAIKENWKALTCNISSITFTLYNCKCEVLCAKLNTQAGMNSDTDLICCQLCLTRSGSVKRRHDGAIGVRTCCEYPRWFCSVSTGDGVCCSPHCAASFSSLYIPVTWNTRGELRTRANTYAHRYANAVMPMFCR